MRKDVSILKAMELTGSDAYSLLGVDRTTKQWIKRSVNTVVGSNALVSAIEEITVEEIAVEVEEPVLEIVSINKPSDRFDIDDYIRYQEYMIKHGGKPSVSDYFKAIEYYKSRA